MSAENISGTAQECQKIVAEVERRVFGNEETARFLTVAFLVGGHVLLEGPPGVGKTLLAKSFAAAVGGEFRRIQFTPDLMPSDITGVSIYDRELGKFRFSPGPLFTDIVLADEINRTPPKTQAALLEAMEERCVSVDGVTYPLGASFCVVATQNNVEFEGTFPLLEAQLDRFLLRLKLSYPSEEVERAMVQAYSGVPGGGLSLPPLSEQRKKLSAESLLTFRNELRGVELSPTMLEYIVRLIRRTRQHPGVELGASPRCGLHLSLMAKAWAVTENRTYVIPDDVQKVFAPVVNHRLILRPEALSARKSVEDIIRDLLAAEPVPEKLS